MDSVPTTTIRKTWLGVLVALLSGVLALSGCSALGGDTNDPGTVVIATHDSWSMPKSLIKQFEDETGLTVKLQSHGDAGGLTAKMVLTKDAPIADAVYGIDNTFATKAVDAGVFADFTPGDVPATAKRFALPAGAGGEQLTPIDYGDVCINVDDVWFANHRLAPPRSFGDLTDPRYKNLLVIPGAATSSPGMAFLVATIGTYGQGWKNYWSKLLDNGAKLTSGWSDAYEVDFTAGGGSGDRPIVVSYASSPPFTIPKGKDRPTTSAVLSTCFRQVEYAGVLAGAKNPAAAKKFIEFMLTKKFQADLPENMYVYPVDTTVALPADWAKWARIAPHPVHVPAAEIDANRARWLTDWRDLVTR